MLYVISIRALQLSRVKGPAVHCNLCGLWCRVAEGSIIQKRTRHDVSEDVTVRERGTRRVWVQHRWSWASAQPGRATGNPVTDWLAANGRKSWKTVWCVCSEAVKLIWLRPRPLRTAWALQTHICCSPAQVELSICPEPALWQTSPWPVAALLEKLTGATAQGLSSWSGSV